MLMLLMMILTNNKVFMETLYYYLMFNFQLMSPFGVPVPGPAPETKDIKNLYESIMNNYINILNKYTININKDNINKLKFLDNYTEEEKGYYLSGLFEGDGNIYTRCFSITFSLEDVLLANYLCTYFKIGHITAKYNSNKELTAVKWNIMKKKEQEVFMNYINGKLLTYKRYDQYFKYNFNNRLNIKLLKPKEFDLTLNPWLTGFNDADGYFYTGFQKHKNSQWLKFHLELSQKDSYILDIIKKYFKTGGILKRDYKSGATAYIYKAQSSKAMKPFIEYFNNYQPLSTRRYKQYLLLNIAYLLKLNKLHMLTNSLLMLKELMLLQSVKNMSLEMKNELNNRVKIIINKTHYNNIE
ncbi:hypothetical protein A560_mgp08 (mitochondrion) [Saccharomyces paradoxus]|uniref:Homing endonuclease LAGLIDADG domain-containing protein n=4 Tax=Saccharomyces TaxID=4930 RepID=I1Z685_SACPA|nr:hypothetical protein A560_mgp08 [Saccharomyces paradoxus]AFJ14776.1 hypothetical protein [Saccharomyces paradoxus]QTF75968.1 hypothetical protein [Saccharomyces cerevisiae x Saccharomyces paradoxus]